MSQSDISRRQVLRTAGGAAAALALGGAGILGTASAARAAGDGFGLRIVDRDERDQIGRAHV